MAFLIETLERHPDEVTLVALGPLTNVALALRRRPDLAPRIRSLVFMGGNARVPGNVTPAAEFNFWFDPEAAAAVLAAPIPHIVMFGLDITNHAPLHKTRFDRIVAVDTPLTRLMRHDMGPRFDADPARDGVRLGLHHRRVAHRALHRHRVGTAAYRGRHGVRSGLRRNRRWPWWR